MADMSPDPVAVAPSAWALAHLGTPVLPASYWPPDNPWAVTFAHGQVVSNRSAGLVPAAGGGGGGGGPCGGGGGGLLWGWRRGWGGRGGGWGGGGWWVGGVWVVGGGGGGACGCGGAGGGGVGGLVGWFGGGGGGLVMVGGGVGVGGGGWGGVGLVCWGGWGWGGGGVLGGGVGSVAVSVWGGGGGGGVGGGGEGAGVGGGGGVGGGAGVRGGGWVGWGGGGGGAGWVWWGCGWGRGGGWCGWGGGGVLGVAARWGGGFVWWDPGARAAVRAGRRCSTSPAAMARSTPSTTSRTGRRVHIDGPADQLLHRRPATLTSLADRRAELPIGHRQPSRLGVAVAVGPLRIPGIEPPQQRLGQLRPGRRRLRTARARSRSARQFVRGRRHVEPDPDDDGVRRGLDQDAARLAGLPARRRQQQVVRPLERRLSPGRARTRLRPRPRPPAAASSPRSPPARSAAARPTWRARPRRRHPRAVEPPAPGVCSSATSTRPLGRPARRPAVGVRRADLGDDRDRAPSGRPRGRALAAGRRRRGSQRRHGCPWGATGSVTATLDARSASAAIRAGRSARDRHSRGRPAHHCGQARRPRTVAMTRPCTRARPGPSRSSTRKGKKTARERIEALLDEGSFVELDEFARHRSTQLRHGQEPPVRRRRRHRLRHGRRPPGLRVRQDFTIFGGSLGEVFGEKIVKVIDLAMKTGCPVIGINDCGGARIQEGVVSLGLYGEIFCRNVQASGVIPQISLIMGAARRRARLLPRAHRLHRHGRQDLAHVHHRPRRHQDGHRRGRRLRGARRRPHAQHQERCTRTTSPPTRTTRSTTSRRCSPTCRATTSTRLPVFDTEASTPTSEDRRVPRHAHPGLGQPALRHAPRSSSTCSTTATSSRCTRCSRRTSSCGFGRVEGHPVGRRGQPADALRRLPRHRRLGEGRPLRAHLRRVQHPGRSPSSTSPASCPAPTRSGTASSAAARS